MILHAEDGLRLVTQTFDGLVVQVHVRDFQIRRQGLRVNRETVVLRRNFDFAGLEFLDRVVGAAVAELELIGIGAHRERQDLMSETDAEDRDIRLDQLTGVADRIVEHGRIAGPVAEKHPVRLAGEQVSCGRLGREHADLAAVGREPPQDVPLHAVVIRRDLQRPPGATFRIGRELVECFGVRLPVEGGVAGDAANQVRSLHRGHVPRSRRRGAGDRRRPSQ